MLERRHTPPISTYADIFDIHFAGCNHEQFCQMRRQIRHRSFTTFLRLGAKKAPFRIALRHLRVPTHYFSLQFTAALMRCSAAFTAVTTYASRLISWLRPFDYLMRLAIMPSLHAIRRFLTIFTLSRRCWLFSLLLGDAIYIHDMALTRL